MDGSTAPRSTAASSAASSSTVDEVSSDARSAAANDAVAAAATAENGVRGEACEADLPKTVTLLRHSNGAQVYLVGTAHYSEQSCDDVVKTIQHAQPDVLMVEICESRSVMLQLSEEEMAEANSGASLDVLVRLVQQRGAVMGCFQYILALMTNQLAGRLGRMPGGEFRAGYLEAKKNPSCRICLGDRPLQVTLARLLAKLSFFQKLRLFSHIVHAELTVTPEEVEEFKNKDLLEQLLADLGKNFPTLVEVLVDERDRYMAHQLQYLCRHKVELPRQPGQPAPGVRPPVVVSVVGIGHVKGISQYFPQNIPNITEISIVPVPPPPSRTWVYFKRGVFYGVVFFGLYRLGRRVVPAIAVDWAASQMSRVPRRFI